MAPNATAETKLKRNVYATARPSKRISRSRGSVAGPADTSSRTPPQARARPTAPPTSDSSTLSAMKYRAMPARPAPSARRTATSRWRASDRTRNRFAMLAQATSSTRPTEPSTIHRALNAADDRLLECPCHRQDPDRPGIADREGIARERGLDIGNEGVEFIAH